MTKTVVNTNIGETENKIPYTTSVFVRTAVLNTKIRDVENKIPDISKLVTKTD